MKNTEPRNFPTGNRWYTFVFSILFPVALLASSKALATEAQSAEVAKSFIAALSNREAAQAMELLHPEAVLEMPYPLAPGENKDGTRRMWGEYFNSVTAARTFGIPLDSLPH